jgi:hypothetical protein
VQKTNYLRIRSGIFFTEKLYNKICFCTGSARSDPSYRFCCENIGDAQLNKLYQLIYRRTLASQMANAKIEKTVIEIGNAKFHSILKHRVK